jgi:hypothetical protein
LSFIETSMRIVKFFLESILISAFKVNFVFYKQTLFYNHLKQLFFSIYYFITTVYILIFLSQKKFQINKNIVIVNGNSLSNSNRPFLEILKVIVKAIYEL